MIGLIVVATAVGVAVAVALVVDRRDRRHGAARRSTGAMSDEATHNRIDIDAVPYEPARHAGQRDWATYRRRDRKGGH